MEDIIKEMRAHGATCADLKTTADELCALLKRTDQFSELHEVRIRKDPGAIDYLIDLAYKDRHGIDIIVRATPKSVVGAGFIIAALKEVKE